MMRTRRQVVCGLGLAGMAAALGTASRANSTDTQPRRYRFAHVDVFTQQPLLGNPLDVFLDARGLSDTDMLAITRETYLNEATFVFPREAAVEQKQGVRVRIFTPDGEVPFAGHPTLGTATVLRSLRLRSAGAAQASDANRREIVLDLNVGKVPVTFSTDGNGQVFGEMRQVPPEFGALHDKQTVAQLHNFSSDDIADYAPIQTVSTGLPFIIVPLKRLSALQSMRIDAEKMNAFMAQLKGNYGFYYVTRETGDSQVQLRARCPYVGGEDAATGSAAGCTAAWLVHHGVTPAEQSVHIRQGVEMKRNSDIFVRAGLEGDKIVNIRVGGYAVQSMEGELSL